ncbi:MAG: GNAT family N-acetyltransferase, partial [Blautia massiliensis (ex Durand et al. 2017)]
YEQWCDTHPLTDLPKWKRGENMRLVKNDEQWDQAACLFAEGRYAVCEAVCTPLYLDTLTPENCRAELLEEKRDGWAFYLHYTAGQADGMVGVCHKTGGISHLFVTPAAQGRGIGTKMLDFARKKLPEHPHPTLTTLNTNTRALALYRRMGWRVAGVQTVYDPAQDPTSAVYTEEWKLRYEG